jgi:hypothetical protein
VARHRRAGPARDRRDDRLDDRRRPTTPGHRTDLQQSRKQLLCDPKDTWLPTGDDYEDLAVEHDGWLDRARAAVREAVARAEDNRRELVRVDVDKVNGAVAQDEGVPVEVSAAVMEDYSERWFILDRLRPDGSVIPYEEAVALADAAMDGIPDDDVQELFERTELLDGQLIEPARHYAWCGVTS